MGGDDERGGEDVTVIVVMCVGKPYFDFFFLSLGSNTFLYRLCIKVIGARRETNRNGPRENSLFGLYSDIYIAVPGVSRRKSRKKNRNNPVEGKRI